MPNCFPRRCPRGPGSASSTTTRKRRSNAPPEPWTSPVLIRSSILPAVRCSPGSSATPAEAARLLGALRSEPLDELFQCLGQDCELEPQELGEALHGRDVLEIEQELELQVVVDSRLDPFGVVARFQYAIHRKPGGPQ